MRRGIPVRHFPKHAGARRYATDPEYRASLTEKKALARSELIGARTGFNDSRDRNDRGKRVADVRPAIADRYRLRLRCLSTRSAGMPHGAPGVLDPICRWAHARRQLSFCLPVSFRGEA
jgi:hypothetical protein